MGYTHGGDRRPRGTYVALVRLEASGCALWLTAISRRASSICLTSAPYRCCLEPALNRTIELPRLLQIEGPPVSSVTEQCSLAHLPRMREVRKATVRRIIRTLCIRCGAALPPAASTGDRVSFADLIVGKHRMTTDEPVGRRRFKSESSTVL